MAMLNNQRVIFIVFYTILHHTTSYSIYTKKYTYTVYIFWVRPVFLKDFTWVWHFEALPENGHGWRGECRWGQKPILLMGQAACEWKTIEL